MTNQLEERLRRVALEVDRLVRTAGSRRDFQDAMRRWAEARARTRERSKHPPGVNLIPARGLSADERFVLLAAVHDVHSTGPRLDLWCPRERAPRNLNALLAGAPYGVAQSRVKDFAVADVTRVESELAILRRKYTGRPNASTTTSPASPTQSGPQPHASKPPSSRRQRVKRAVAEPLILAHLFRRPHDTAAQVAKQLGCSVGVVSESKSWKLNQLRLKAAKARGMEPTAIELNENAVNEAGGDAGRQLREHRDSVAAHDDRIDEGERELFERIGKYKNEHPNASPSEVAKEVGCTAGDVERRDALLGQLTSEQAGDQLEDEEVDDPTAKRGERQKWVDKRV